MATERLLLDTNILLDVVDAKRSGHTAAAGLHCSTVDLLGVHGKASAASI